MSLSILPKREPPAMRASLLINCSAKEAQEVRRRAALQRRTVSGYVLYSVMRFVESNEQAIRKANDLPVSKPVRLRVVRPRTTLHIHCSDPEGDRIRLAAQSKSMTMSGFVLDCLHRCWEVEDQLLNNDSLGHRLTLGAG